MRKSFLTVLLILLLVGCQSSNDQSANQTNTDLSAEAYTESYYSDENFNNAEYEDFPDGVEIITGINSDDYANYDENVNLDDLYFLRDFSTETEIVETEYYSGFATDSSYSSNPDEIEYKLFASKEKNNDEVIIFDDSNYKVYTIGNGLYVNDKSVSSESPRQYLKVENFDKFLVSGTFYKNDKLYIYADNPCEKLVCGGQEYEPFSTACRVLVISKNELLLFKNVVFSEDFSYMTYINDSYPLDYNNGIYTDDLYLINTDTFDIEVTKSVGALSKLVSNNGTIIFTGVYDQKGLGISKQRMCVKFPNDSTIYVLLANDVNSPLYIDNDKNQLFITNSIGIKKISTEGEEIAFKYAGFAVNPSVHHGIRNGIKSSMIDLWKWDADTEIGEMKILDLKDY